MSLLKVGCSCPKTSLGKYFSDFPTLRGPQDLPGPLPGTFATPSIHRPDAALLPHLPFPACLGSPGYPSLFPPPCPWGGAASQTRLGVSSRWRDGHSRNTVCWRWFPRTGLKTGCTGSETDWCKFCWILGEIKFTLKFQQILDSGLCVSSSRAPFPM